MLWHQSLKSIHYRILLIFQTKKTTDLMVKTWGDKRHVIPPCQNMGGDTYPPSPSGFTPLVSNSAQFCRKFEQISTVLPKFRTNSVTLAQRRHNYAETPSKQCHVGTTTAQFGSESEAFISSDFDPIWFHFWNN